MFLMNRVFPLIHIPMLDLLNISHKCIPLDTHTYAGFVEYFTHGLWDSHVAWLGDRQKGPQTRPQQSPSNEFLSVSKEINNTQNPHK